MNATHLLNLEFRRTRSPSTSHEQAFAGRSPDLERDHFTRQDYALTTKVLFTAISGLWEQSVFKLEMDLRCYITRKLASISKAFVDSCNTWDQVQGQLPAKSTSEACCSRNQITSTNLPISYGIPISHSYYTSLVMYMRHGRQSPVPEQCPFHNSYGSILYSQKERLASNIHNYSFGSLCQTTELRRFLTACKKFSNFTMRQPSLLKPKMHHDLWILPHSVSYCSAIMLSFDNLLQSLSCESTVNGHSFEMVKPEVSDNSSVLWPGFNLWARLDEVHIIGKRMDISFSYLTSSLLVVSWYPWSKGSIITFQWNFHWSHHGSFEAPHHCAYRLDSKRLLLDRDRVSQSVFARNGLDFVNKIGTCIEPEFGNLFIHNTFNTDQTQIKLLYMHQQLQLCWTAWICRLNLLCLILCVY